MRKVLRLQEGWTTVILLILMMLVSSIALRETDIIPGLEIIPTITVIALLVGIALAKSQFKSGTAHLYSFIYGVFVVFVLVGLILPDELTWRERVFDILLRQGIWMRKAIEGGTSRDGIIFVVQTSAVYWLLGYTAAWYTFRQLRIWRVIIPSGLVLLSAVYYYNGPKPLPLYLAGYVLLSLLYIARTHLTLQEMQWRAASVRFERSIWFDFLRAGFLAAVVILFLSWSMPTLSASPLAGDAMSRAGGPWREFQDTWTRLFSSLRSYGTATSDPYQDTLVLGGPRTVGNTPIMDVYLNERLPSIYWHAVSFDTYNSGFWSVADKGETTLYYPDDGKLVVPDTKARIEVVQTVYNYLPNSSFLYAAPQMVGANRQMFVESNETAGGEQLISSVRSRYVLRQGDSYEVTSRVSAADATSLRGASTNYPEWISETYLQLPDTITPQTLGLAGKLTEPYDNSFDKALIIRDYLRENITYNDQIPAPPEGIDPVHHTLFVSREGYCNYYASAMAIMLRSQGIPARISSGYAQGEFIEEDTFFRVRASNAHTWAEAYFPEFGWIQFEPTAVIPIVDRPETSGGGDAFASLLSDDERQRQQLGEALDVPDEELTNIEDLLNEGDRNTTAEPGFFGSFPIWQALGAVLVLFMAGGILLMANATNKRVEGHVDSSYERLGFWARLIGVFFRPADTPYERADMMTTAVPDGHAPIRTLTRQFVHKQFRPDHATDDDFDPHEEWRQLRPLLIRQSIKTRLQAWRKRLSRRL